MEHGHVISVIGEHCDGTHCELIALPVAQVFPLDDGVSFEDAAAFPLVYETAYRMLVTKAGVQEGEWALIWGIGGGVATGAFEISRALGVKTIVTSGSDDKLEQARAWGADVAVNHHTGDVPRRRQGSDRQGRGRRRRDGRRGDLGRSLASVRPAGRVVVCGARAGRTRRRRSTASGGSSSSSTAPRWGRETTSSAPTTSSRAAGRASIVDRVFPLAETRAAHERLEAGEQLGKIVISIP